MEANNTIIIIREVTEEIVEIDGRWHAVVDGESVLDAPTLIELVTIINRLTA